MVITKEQRFWLESDFVLELLKQIPASVFWKDKNSVYLGCNNAFIHSLGLSSPEEVVGKTDYDLPTTREESDAFRTDDKQVIESKKPKLNIEEFQTLPNGKKVVLLTNKVPLVDKQNNVVGILGIYYDITDRKQKEEELREAKEKAEIANKAKTEFLENMRHDIRTPIMGIIGFADMIKNSAVDARIKEYVDNLTASSYALLNLLNGVLEAIKVSSGEIPLLKKKFNLENELKEIILLNQAKAQQKNLELLFEYDAAIPNYLLGDARRIHRIVLELVTNALNFTHQGYVRLSAQLGKNNEDDVVVKIMVEDTGIGIAPEQQQDIYVQFKRLTPSYEGIYKGSGLGLSIVKQFVEELRGELYVESKVGEGSTFTFITKLKKPLLDDALGSENLLPINNKFIPTVNIKPLKKSTNQTTQPIKNRILVVEDNAMAAHIVTDMLSTMGCQVDVAETGHRAVQLAAENLYDLIFMDIGLPDMDGYETTRKIRLDASNKKQVPIIALTAHGDEENQQNCIDAGMSAVLIKPLLKEKAEDILNTFIA